jgi:hypothetical protein
LDFERFKTEFPKDLRRRIMSKLSPPDRRKFKEMLSGETSSRLGSSQALASARVCRVVHSRRALRTLSISDSAAALKRNAPAGGAIRTTLALSEIVSVRHLSVALWSANSMSMNSRHAAVLALVGWYLSVVVYGDEAPRAERL